MRGARIRVVDRDGEEFEKAARGSVAGGRDGRRHDRSAARSVSSTVRGPDLTSVDS
jgi:hypothetical protein